MGPTADETPAARRSGRTGRNRARRRPAPSALLLLALAAAPALLIVPPLAAAQSSAPTPVPDAVESTEGPTSSAPTFGPTGTPTSGPTFGPTAGPTFGPTAGPTAKPTDGPTGTPTPKPTPGPTSEPTEGPTREPTEEPTPLPTLDPTSNPTEDPTSAPTSGPTEVPTSAPTQAPIVGTREPTLSKMPTPIPTPDPTVGPTSGPTSDPTVGPTSGPTSDPTVGPTPRPTGRPLEPGETGDPTPGPTLGPTPEATDGIVAETAAPTPNPTWEAVVGGSKKGMTMVLDGIDPFDKKAELAFEDVYVSYVKEFWEVTSEEYVPVLKLEVVVRGQDPPFVSRRRRRGLGVGVGVSVDVGSDSQGPAPGVDAASSRSLEEDEEKAVKVTYDVTYEYRSDTTDERFLRMPFDRKSKRDDFAQRLIDTDQTDAFQSLESVAYPGIPAPEEPESNTTMIIAIVCAVVGALLVAGIAFWIYRKRAKGRGAPQYDESLKGEEEHKPISQLQLSTLRNDEVSTLAEPTPRMGVIQSGESLAGYGDQSVATVDYDYSKAYGGGGDSIVSSAGGTLGSGTRGGTTTAADSATAGLAAAGAAQSVFSDDASFDKHFGGGPGAGHKEELIDIYAPPGKLGVVIDTPDEGPPVVHAIKDSSVIADQLKVGDKLVAVDDEDVRSMTAIKVSKMISRKSTNPTRKLTVIRTSVA